MLPGGQEAPERRGIHRFNLVPECGEGAAAQSAQDLDVAPLAPGTAWAELALHNTSLLREAAEGFEHHGCSEAQPLGRGERGERAMGAGETSDQVAEGIIDRLDEGDRDADGQRCAEGIAQTARVFDDCPALGAGDVRSEQAIRASQPGELSVQLVCSRGHRPGRPAALHDLLER